MRYLFLTVLLATPFSVNAAGFFRPAFSYTIDENESNGITEKEARRMIDLAGGYITDKGITILAQYSLEKKKTTTENSGTSSSTDSDRTSIGVGGGWTTRQDIGPYIHGIYYMQSEEIEDGVTYKGGGYEVDLGFKAAIRKLSIAFQLSYRAFEYDEFTSSGGTSAALPQPRKQANLDPTFAIFLEF